MDPLIAGYCILPFVVAFILVFVHWDYHPGNGDLAGVFEFLVPAFVLCGIHAAAYTLHWSLVAVIVAAELAFIGSMYQHVQNRQNRQNAVEAAIELEMQRMREDFAARVHLPPDDPIIDSAYAHLTGEARGSVHNRGQLAALLGEYADAKQKEQRRKRLFKE
jgi:phosphotransferase system  glucose/maltose/N-acetylglucosamine-specific IIC component